MIAIDLGTPQPDMAAFSIPAADALLDAIKDRAGPGASEDRINDIMAQEICGQMRSKKTAEGAAATFWKYGGLISRMRDVSPDMHGMIVLEFAELLTVLPWRRGGCPAGG